MNMWKGHEYVTNAASHSEKAYEKDRSEKNVEILQQF